MLVVTYGRSGSTLLQGILNGIPGVCVLGENGNVYFDYFMIWKKLSELRRKHKGALLPKNPWYRIDAVEDDQYFDYFKEFLTLFIPKAPGVRCIGFKEVRYINTGEYLEEYLDFLQKVFPDVALIINTRKLENVTKSGWWKEKDAAESTLALREFESRLLQYAASKANCFHIQYEEVVENGQKLRGLFDFLGADYCAEDVALILNTPHSYAPEQQHIKNLFKE